MNIYFDNAATTKVRDEAVDAARRVMLGHYGNPSSLHSMGRAAAAELADARKSVAGALGAHADEICFTSGGTESSNLAVLGAAQALFRNGRHILTSAIEHDAVFEPIRKLEKDGWEVTYLKPDAHGRISPESFEAHLRKDTALATIMLVNNETGSVNPIADYSGIIKKRGYNTMLHTDAVQGFCKIPFSVKSLGIDLLSVSSHKVHGPKGAGALYVRHKTRLRPIIYGGGQESGKRSGTEPLPAIAGFGAAAQLGWQELKETAASGRELREHIVTKLKERLPEAVVIGPGDSPYLLNISLPGFKSEVLMNCLDMEDICVSKGSACKKGLRSRVLEAMGLKSDVIDGALRLSFSKHNTKEESDILIASLAKAAETLIRSR